MIHQKNQTLLILYSLVLIFHFSYAFWAIVKKRFSLEIAHINSPFKILFFLFLINGFSITVFFHLNSKWCIFHVVFHLTLMADEVWRTKKVPQRWPFILNHFLFSSVLAGAFL